MTTPRKRRKPTPTIDVEAHDGSVDDLIDAPEPVAAKPDWFKRIMFVVIVALAWHTFTARQGSHSPDTTPEPTPVATDALYDKVAPLFPAGAEESASLYAAYFAAQADMVKDTGKPIPQPVFVAARRAMGLADNPDLEKVVLLEFDKFKDLPASGSWPPEKLEQLITTYYDLSDACLRASDD